MRHYYVCFLLELICFRCTWHIYRRGSDTSHFANISSGRHQAWTSSKSTIIQIAEEKDLGVHLTEDFKCVGQLPKPDLSWEWWRGISGDYRQTRFLAYIQDVHPASHGVLCPSVVTSPEKMFREGKEQRQDGIYRDSVTCLTKLDCIVHLGLTTLEERRTRGDLIEAYKIMTGKEAVDQ